MKKISLIFFLIFHLCVKAQDSTKATYVLLNDTIEGILDLGCRQIGAGYQMGASGNGRFDCSGLVNYVASKYGHKIPRSSSDIAKLGHYVEVDSLRPGDLIFFQGRYANSIGHVAIVSDIRGGNIYILHATTQRGVIEEILQKNEYFMKRWLFNKRLF